MIESVRVGGREQKTNRFSSAWQPSVLVPPGHEQLEIHYTALNFPAPREVQFKYRLEGRETAWTEAGDTRVAYYNKVPPGIIVSMSLPAMKTACERNRRCA